MIKSKASCRPSVLIIGPVPPPVHGMSVAVQQILQSSLSAEYHFLHVNTALLGTIGNPGQLRPTKVFRDIRLLARVTQVLALRRPPITYLAISQTRLGIFRDTLLILLCDAFGSKVIVHLHGGYFRILYEGLSSWEQRFIAFGLKKLEWVVVLSACFRPLFDGLVDLEKIRVVHNGVRDIPVISQYRASDGNSSGPLRVLFLSNLQPEKGVFDVLQALSILKDKGVPFRARFAGAWLNQATKIQIQRFVSELGLEEHVSFLGLVWGTSKAELLASSDVFVFPSYQFEGQPISIIEAMMAGLPIIATARGSIPEMIVEGQNGFLVPEHDPQAIANRLSLLSQNPCLRISMGQVSRQRYLDAYTEAQYITGVKAVLDEVLQNK